MAQAIENFTKESGSLQKQAAIVPLTDDTQRQPAFGELFITNDELNGGIQSLKHFRGKLITNVTGGAKKLFVIEEELSQGVISTLHAQEYDDFEYTYSEEGYTAKNLEEIFATFESRGQIKKIICGKRHTTILTEDGKIFTYGVGEYGALGHGGVVHSQVPRQILKIARHKVVQIACGEYHTLALTQTRDVYSWGRGFEGQLGVAKKSSSVPTHLKQFFLGYSESQGEIKVRISHVACGSFHSMAIDESGQLYMWGEAKLGACGRGKRGKEIFPSLLDLNASAAVSGATAGAGHDKEVPQTVGTPKSKIRIDERARQHQPGLRIVRVSGGFAHTACVTESGELFTFGFNVMGQLGLGDAKTRYYPQRVSRDILGNAVPRFVDVQCGYNTTFAIDESGLLWSWGGGNIAHKNDKKQDLPRRVTENTDFRRFTDVCATANAATFFAPMRIMSVRPNYGPSCGGTLISLLGTGFADTGRQSLRFCFGTQKKLIDVALNYDAQTESFNCITPNFQDAYDESLDAPTLCELQVTLDGKLYTLCEQQFLLYSARLAVTSINPKYSSVRGGSELQLLINIDPLVASYLKHLTVGFQRKLKREEQQQQQQQQLPNTLQQNGRKDSTLRPQGSQHENAALQPAFNTASSEDKVVNPLNLALNDPELERENYICIEGYYVQGKITCKIPRLEEYRPDQLQFNVDVSLNGQQFTGQPSSFRFYDVKITSIAPNNDIIQGGAKVVIAGEGFFDTLNKKIMFETHFGQRLRDVSWDKKDKAFTFVVPPAGWLLGGQDESPELLSKICERGVDVSLTLNGTEWISVGKFYYTDIIIERITPAAVDASLNEEDKKAIWLREEPYTDPYAAIHDEAEREKKRIELQAKQDEETQEMEQLFKKGGSHLYLHGNNFIKTDILVQFIFQDKIRTVKGVYKNERKIGVVVPELEDVPVGIQEVHIEISLNGQQFSNCGKVFRYLSFDKNWTPQERQKYEDEELKKLKLPVKKGAKK